MPQEEVHAPMACTVVELRVSLGQTVGAGEALLVDAVIDPAQTRAWLSRGLASARVADNGATDPAGRFIDPW